MPNEINYKIPDVYYSLGMEESTPLFSINQYLIVEKKFPKMFVYKMLDMDSGLTTFLCSSGRKIPLARHNEIVELLWTKHGIKQQEMISLEELQSKAHYIFEDIMIKNGFTIRADQVDLSVKMVEVFYNRQILVAEAGVGMEKTFAYIIAAIIQRQYTKNDFFIRALYKDDKNFTESMKMPIIISTSSIEVQREIHTNYLPKISEILLQNNVIDRPLQSIIRKGMGNYICQARLDYYMSNLDDKERELLSKQTASAIDLNKLKAVNNTLKTKINVKRCNYQNCRKYDECNYIKFLKSALSYNYDFQICNHNYLFADINKRKLRLAPLLPNYQGIIIDEADNLIEVSKKMYEHRFKRSYIEEAVCILRNVKLKHKKNKTPLSLLCNEVFDLNMQLFNEFEMMSARIALDKHNEGSEEIAGNFSPENTNIFKRIKSKLNEILELLKQEETYNKRHYKVSTTFFMIENIIKKIDPFVRLDKIMIWGVHENHKLHKIVTICSIPKNLNQKIYEDLTSKNLPIILASGTLSASDSFAYFKDKMGLNFSQSNRVVEMSRIMHSENTD